MFIFLPSLRTTIIIYKVPRLSKFSISFTIWYIFCLSYSFITISFSPLCTFSIFTKWMMFVRPRHSYRSFLGFVNPLEDDTFNTFFHNYFPPYFLIKARRRYFLWVCDDLTPQIRIYYHIRYLILNLLHSHSQSFIV